MNENLLIEDENVEENEIKDENNEKLELENLLKISQETETEQSFKIEYNLKDNSDYNKSIKILLLGESQTGKTSLINRICFNKFVEEFSPTVTVESYDYFIRINDFTLRIQIWDTPGKDEYSSVIKNYSQSTDYAIFFYSVDDKTSFNKINEWYTIFQQKSLNNNINNILIGNKKDLDNDKKIITFEQGENLARQYKCFMFKEISCKNEDDIDNILEFFNIIANTYYKYNGSRYMSFDDESLSYEASNSIIEILNKEQKSKIQKKQKKKRCCCLII